MQNLLGAGNDLAVGGLLQLRRCCDVVTNPQPAAAGS